MVSRPVVGDVDTGAARRAPRDGLRRRVTPTETEGVLEGRVAPPPLPYPDRTPPSRRRPSVPSGSRGP